MWDFVLLENKEQACGIFPIEKKGTNMWDFVPLTKIN